MALSALDLPSPRQERQTLYQRRLALASRAPSALHLSNNGRALSPRRPLVPAKLTLLPRSQTPSDSSSPPATPSPAIGKACGSLFPASSTSVDTLVGIYNIGSTATPTPPFFLPPSPLTQSPRTPIKQSLFPTQHGKGIEGEHGAVRQDLSGDAAHKDGADLSTNLQCFPKLSSKLGIPADPVEIVTMRKTPVFPASIAFPSMAEATRARKASQLATSGNAHDDSDDDDDVAFVFQPTPPLTPASRAFSLRSSPSKPIDGTTHHPEGATTKNIKAASAADLPRIVRHASSSNSLRQVRRKTSDWWKRKIDAPVQRLKKQASLSRILRKRSEPDLSAKRNSTHHTEAANDYQTHRQLTFVNVPAPDEGAIEELVEDYEAQEADLPKVRKAAVRMATDDKDSTPLPVVPANAGKLNGGKRSGETAAVIPKTELRLDSLAKEEPEKSDKDCPRSFASTRTTSDAYYQCDAGKDTSLPPLPVDSLLWSSAMSYADHFADTGGSDGISFDIQSSGIGGIVAPKRPEAYLWAAHDAFKNILRLSIVKEHSEGSLTAVADRQVREVAPSESTADSSQRDDEEETVSMRWSRAASAGDSLNSCGECRGGRRRAEGRCSVYLRRSTTSPPPMSRVVGLPADKRGAQDSCVSSAIGGLGGGGGGEGTKLTDVRAGTHMHSLALLSTPRTPKRGRNARSREASAASTIRSADRAGVASLRPASTVDSFVTARAGSYAWSSRSTSSAGRPSIDGETAAGGIDDSDKCKAEKVALNIATHQQRPTAIVDPKSSYSASVSEQKTPRARRRAADSGPTPMQNHAHAMTTTTTATTTTPTSRRRHRERVASCATPPPLRPLPATPSIKQQR